ncbi:MAG: 4'-phosphopantetheinyl transferase superfamily protein [Oscillospiraceae bacterium]|nr:4'-phosphopantetheinyl transferase superfamily protein [Oscillospiraceae bacterium]
MTIGSYLVEFDRFKKLAAKPRFMSKYYSPQEMKYLMERHFPKFIMAEMFATKFAFLKAMGISSTGIRLNEISVLTDYSGAYYISLSGRAKKAFAIKKCRIAISCSHTKNLATGIVAFYE